VAARERLRNWAGNVEYAAARVHRPSSVSELRDLVAGADRVRALGTGHSFSRIADTTGDLVSTAGLPTIMDVDDRAGTVTVSAGVRYGELGSHLHACGYALHNLASLPHISVAGACATATHGSGDGNGNLATAVTGLDLVTADGGLTRVEGDELRAVVVGLGMFGVVTALIMALRPTFEVRQHVYQDLPWDAPAMDFDEVMGAAYSVSLFTRWAGPTVEQVWLKQIDDMARPRRWLGATLADAPRHPVAGMPAVHCTEQLGVPGPWHERLPHFRLGFTPSSGDELQSEFFVPRAHAVAAMDAVRGIADLVAPVLQVSEVRTVAADDLWLSPCHGRDSVAIHFTWIADHAAVAPALAAVEDALAPFAPRPHWAKLTGMVPTETGYGRLPDAVRLAAGYDPAGKFRGVSPWWRRW
jgi:alditol oxidase